MNTHTTVIWYLSWYSLTKKTKFHNAHEPLQPQPNRSYCHFIIIITKNCLTILECFKVFIICFYHHKFSKYFVATSAWKKKIVMDVLLRYYVRWGRHNENNENLIKRDST